MLLAAQPLEAQDDSGASGYAVRGVVTDSVSGQPVPRALVLLNEENAMMTDGSGGFAFDNVPAGSYSVSVRKPGYMGFGHAGIGLGSFSRFSEQAEQPPRRIEVGPAMPSLTFRIEPEASITGQITLSTGDAPGGIRVVLLRREMRNGHPHWQTGGSTATRSDGSFRLGGLAPGSYMLCTMASLDNPGTPADSQAPIWGYPPVYYPGVTDPGSAGVLTVGPGQQAEADFTLTRQQFFLVTAAVRTPGPEEAANFEILDAGGRPTGFDARYDQRLQVIRTHVPNGTWTLDGHAFGRTMGWGRAEIQVAGAPLSLAINLSQIPRFPVFIERDFTSGSAQPSPSNPGLGLNLSAADQVGGGSGGGGMMPVPGTGDTEWQMMVTEPGRYWVEAFPFPPAYVSSITSGGVDLAANPLVIAAGSSPSPIQVTLRDDSGSITGEVSSEAGEAGGAAAPGEIPQIWVYAIPLFSTTATLPETNLRADGTFALTNLAPGSYRVIACDARREIDFHTADGLAAWVGKGQTATVTAGGSVQVSLDVIHAEAIQ